MTVDNDDYALWLSNTHKCSWYGVSCSDIGFVTELDLMSNNLVGTIPPEIYHLSSLKRLALVENCLQSTLPYEMFQLTRLSDIDLSWNYLSDTVPDELYVLKSLAQLRLHGNQDEGNCNRGRTYIYVESQSLVGNILETNIDKLRNLKILEVYMNNFNGHLNRLETLAVNSNSFTGGLPEQISEMPNLKALWLGNNNITGQIPT
ncbi:hypothetical protein ACHAWO_007070 [Cyclotella atomus]|uniref:Leucine-rich repeat-containing N-terminal plant-type domain-containing protein n=1 Tax=Cyclotella atomus TaxID=382360 RepID=A0ABD3MQG9_9STRA